MEQSLNSLNTPNSLSFTCAVCSNKQRFIVKYTKNNFPIISCQNCHVVQALLPQNFDSSLLYTADYFEGKEAQGYLDYVGSKNTLNREFSDTVAVLRTYAPAGSLLEIGCAHGFFLKTASRYFSVKGIEVCETAAAHAQSQGLDVTQGTVSAESLKPYKNLDAVVMLDVLEHLVDPANIVKAIARSLRPGGVLLLTTGDIDSLVGRICGKRWRLMTPPHHLFFFSATSLRRILEDAGFRIERFSYPWKWVPFHLILHQLKLRRLATWIAKNFPSAALPVNLFDAFRCIAIKENVIG